MKRSKRSKLDIYDSILRSIESYGGSGRITHISYGSNIPLDRAKEYLGVLVDAGLLRRQESEDGTDFLMTPRGYEFLRAYDLVRSLVRSDESEESTGANGDE